MKKLLFLVIAVAGFTFSKAQTPADSLQQYTGTYVFPDGSVVPSVEFPVSTGAYSIPSPE